MRVVFYSLQYDSPNKYYFNLKTDVYGFMTSHWKKLCLDKKRSDNWHKQIQDMLSHSKNLFESGMEKYKQNGFWRMKQLTDPWTIRKDKRTGQKRFADKKSEDEDSRPKKRKYTDSEDEEEKEFDDENQEALEEITKLKQSLFDLNYAVDTLKDQLRQKEQSLSDINSAYGNLFEMSKQLQLQVQLQSQQLQAHQFPKIDYSRPLGIAKKQQWHIQTPTLPAHSVGGVNRAMLAPLDGHKWVMENDAFRDGKVPNMLRLSPLSIADHI